MIKVADLFTGAGGLTFGFQYRIKNNVILKRRDFKINFAIEYNTNAVKTFKYNFPEISTHQLDIKNFDATYIMKKDVDINNIDLIIGGPPCQSFSTIGKRINDDRANLYKEFNRILTLLKPKLFLFENVTGLLTMKDENGILVIDKIIKEFKNNGYRIQTQVLNAYDYGIPQLRKRVFIVGIRDDIQLEFEFPKPTKLKFVLSDAISDLEILTEQTIYNRQINSPLTKYQKLLKNSETIEDHFYTPYGDRITKIIHNLGIGESKYHINKKVEEGILPSDLYLTSGYNNTYGRMKWNSPSGTITNSFSTPSSIRCIHPFEMRTLSIREAARIQSFPDSFKFFGSKVQKEIQIGNAVPPLLSIHLANSISEFFKKL